MPKLPLIKKIELMIQGKYPRFVNGGEAERLAMNEGYKSSNASRRCRELVKAGKLERRINENKSVEYRWILQEDFSRNNIFRPEVIEQKQKELTRLFV